MSKTKTKSESVTKKKHFLVEVRGVCCVLVVSAANDNEAVTQAERAVKWGDFKPIGSPVVCSVAIKNLDEYRQEYADVVSDDPDLDWPV